MGFLDDAKKGLDGAKDKLKGAVDKHGDKIGSGLDKAADFASKKTGGKYDEKIAGGVTKAKGALENLDGKNDDGVTGAGSAPKP